MKLDSWHALLNSEEALPPHAFRRAAAVFELVSYVNCMIGCVLSRRADMTPVWIERCRQFMGQRPPKEEEAKYYALVSEYLIAVEKEPNQPLQRNASTGSASNLKSPARRG